MSRAARRVAPHDLVAERAVLGCALLDAGALDQVADMVQPDDWYLEKHRLVWDALLAIHQRGTGIDHVTLRAQLMASEALPRVGEDYLLQLTEGIPSVAMVEDYARIVRDAGGRRRMIATCAAAVEAGYDGEIPAREYLDSVEAAVFEAAKEEGRRGGLQHSSAAIREVAEFARVAAGAPDGITGTRTGLMALDRFTTGMHPGELLIAAGRPGMGKTSFAMGIATTVAETGAPAAFFSLEMPQDQLMMRAVCSEGRIDGRRFRSGKMTKDDGPRFVRASGRLSELPLFIDDEPNISVVQLRSRCRRLAAEQKSLGLVVVDYLQLMRSGTPRESREVEVADISRSLKALAKELGVPILALAQLNRGPENRSDKRPTLGDLRESGAIEQDADAVFFIYRDEVYRRETADQGIAEIIIGKQRNGPTGTAKVAFLKEYTRFENLSTSSEDWMD